MPWTHQLINPHFHNHTLPETHGTSHLKRWYHTDPEKEGRSLEPMNFQGRTCCSFQGNQRTAGGQWWWSHRMSWIRGCLWCTSAGGSARNPWDAAHPTGRNGLGSGWLHMFEGKWSCATTQLSCTCRQDSPQVTQPFFPYEGMVHPITTLSMQKAKKKTKDRFGSFCFGSGKMFCIQKILPRIQISEWWW